MTLAQRLQAWLSIKQWNLADLERETRLSRGHLSQLVRGQEANPSLETLRALARAFGTTVADLLGDEPVVAKKTMTRALSPSLDAFVKRRAKAGEPLTEEEILMLSQVELRGRQPDTDQDWAGVLWAIRSATKER
jgi:transcriptional regulator with XRE-family HTH domain